MNPKTLKELIGEDVCEKILSHILDAEQIPAVMPAFSENAKYYSVQDCLPEFGKQVFCIFPPTEDGFKAKFLPTDNIAYPESWTCYPETGGFLGDEESLVWCYLNENNEWEV